MSAVSLAVVAAPEAVAPFLARAFRFADVVRRFAPHPVSFLRELFALRCTDLATLLTNGGFTARYIGTMRDAGWRLALDNRRGKIRMRQPRDAFAQLRAQDGRPHLLDLAFGQLAQPEGSE